MRVCKIFSGQFHCNFNVFVCLSVSTHPLTLVSFFSYVQMYTKKTRRKISRKISSSYQNNTEHSIYIRLTSVIGNILPFTFIYENMAHRYTGKNANDKQLIENGMSKPNGFSIQL